MECRVFNMTTGKEEDATALLVFARAYHAAWRSIYVAEPAGWHRIMTLGIVLDFGQLGVAAVDASGAGTASGTSGSDPGSSTDQVPPGARHDK